ncbi:hypothetical protein Pmani_003252 [Petrolisthes manimaculis]|uniref:Hexosyltransferase n=1 Tax=Petrolisthes manimaculis TaxID=1843537 RepID=A0AAE1QIY9_9EUCA|nr:hypothetical protein Pmani_003252 [Petrolisthes manimaculis]
MFAKRNLMRVRRGRYLLLLLVLVCGGCLVTFFLHYTTNTTYDVILTAVDIHQWNFQPGQWRGEERPPDRLPNDDNKGNTPHRRALQYLVKEDGLCSGHPDLDIIAYVHSAPEKVDNRQLIRNTWGNTRYYNEMKMRVIFVFGSAKTEKERELVTQESQQYHDIVQLKFDDTYKNLSLKGVGALQWVTEHCPGPTWVLKSDDDMIINIFALSSYLQYITTPMMSSVSHQHSVTPLPNNRIMCAVWYGMPVLRGTGCAKWCVTEEEWPHKTFPTYCSGSAFVFPNNVTRRLYHAYFHAPFLWVDDAYITGVLSREAGIGHHPIHSLYELNHQLIEQNLVKGNRIFCHHPGSANVRAKWWSFIASKEGQPWNFTNSPKLPS